MKKLQSFFEQTAASVSREYKRRWLPAILFGCMGIVSTAGESSRPNILFIMADDHTSQAWSCYGGRLAAYAKTPNIDRLATEGALLKNCFCVNSICVPSRASILTGQYSHRNGVKTLRDALPSAADNVARRLQQTGYQTAFIGKWHLKEAPCLHSSSFHTSPARGNALAL